MAFGVKSMSNAIEIILGFASYYLMLYECY